MVRTYVRKTDQGQWSQEDMRKAAEKVLTKQMTIRKAAEKYNVPYTSLQRRVTFSRGTLKNRGGQQTMDKDIEDCCKFSTRLLHLAGRGYGITPKRVRKYAFSFAERLNIKHNFNTEVNNNTRT